MRRAALLAAFSAFLATTAATPAASRAQGVVPYTPKPPQLSTPWTAVAQDSSKQPLPDYPRPQMRRSDWLNLNGDWGFRSTTAADVPVFGVPLPETIRVPYPTQSALSGIERNSLRSFYRRTFEVPAGWNGRRVLLHFGALTHAADVYVNGAKVGSHVGSYDPFTFDITDKLVPGDNELFVDAVDPSPEAGGQPSGKQMFAPLGNVFFTASSGIWQTVWLEPVAAAHITRLDVEPDVAGSRVLVTPHAADAEGKTVVVTARDGDKVVGQAGGAAGEQIAIPVPAPRLWSPDRPFLYDLTVEIRDGTTAVDRVDGYFGMRSIALKRVGKVTRIVLNGKFLLQDGLLDQGYWPDGIYTAPTDEALRFDIEREKQLGFNMVRKHAKVEPARWYYWADRLGLLVWQDMPSIWPFHQSATDPEKKEFERELYSMVDELRSYPSIIGWIPFNEAWVAFDVGRITDAVKARDPSRLVNGHSGSANCCTAAEPGTKEAGGGGGGDIRDTHLYPGPYAPTPDKRASMIGEYGGFGNRNPLNEWNPAGASATGLALSEYFPDSGAACHRYEQMLEMIRAELRSPGVSGTVFTEWSDVEDEIAGIVTYDRRVVKCDPATLTRLNRAAIEASRNPGKLTPERPRLPDGEVHHWSFDEGGGEAARDLHGGGNQLALKNGAGWAAGKRGAALRVDGGGQSAQAGGPVLDTSNDFTVSAWLLASSATQNASAVSQHGQSIDAFSLGINGSRWGFAMSPGDRPPNQGGQGSNCPGETCVVRASNTYRGFQGDTRDDVRPDRWYHLIGVHRRGTDSVIVYIDGVPVDSRYLGSSFDASGVFAVGEGKPGNGQTDSFAGRVDELRLWRRALSSGEVAQLYGFEQRGADFPGARPRMEDRRTARLGACASAGAASGR